MISKVLPNEDEYFSAQGTQGWPVGIWIAPSRSPTRWQIHAQQPLGALPSQVIHRAQAPVCLGYKTEVWVEKKKQKLRRT